MAQTGSDKALSTIRHADAPWWLIRFSKAETYTNLGITENTGGSSPTQDRYPELLDSVTD